MEPQNIRFGGGVERTFLNPIVLAAIVIAGVLICVSGRKNALAAFLTAGVLIPEDQILYLGALHFPMLRILAFCVLGRICWTKLSGKARVFEGGISGIDKAMMVMGLFIFIDGLLLWRVWGELVFQLGNLTTVLGVYFSLRFLIQDFEDVKHGIRVLAGVTGVIALIMAYEHLTGVNLVYSTLGGARASVLGMSISRDDHLRAAGVFGHPILAGTFGGIMLPVFVGLGLADRRDRKYAALGVAACTLMSFAASSSTALFGFFGGIIGLCFWPLRRRMRIIRWGIVGTLVALHLYMRSPVWHLISDIDLTGNSSSYHRYQLINQCIVHFWDWVFVGTKSYASWGWDMWDLCNQYVAIADQSGLIPLLSFVTVIVVAFKYLGRARRAAEDKQQRMFLWALSASVFANVVAFFGVSYFDQTIVAWYALLAMIHATMVSVRSRAQRERVLGEPDPLLTPAIDGCLGLTDEVPSFAVRP